MINKIMPSIFIGDDRDASSIMLIKDTTITAILDLTNLHIDLVLDDEAIEQVETAVERLKGLVLRGNNVLVHCHAGIDRAPFVVAYFLYKIGYNFQEAYDLVKEKRPQTIQHWEWASQFLTKGEDTTYDVKKLNVGSKK